MCKSNVVKVNSKSFGGLFWGSLLLEGAVSRKAFNISAVQKMKYANLLFRFLTLPLKDWSFLKGCLCRVCRCKKVERLPVTEIQV